MGAWDDSSSYACACAMFRSQPPCVDTLLKDVLMQLSTLVLGSSAAIGHGAQTHVVRLLSHLTVPRFCIFEIQFCYFAHTDIKLQGSASTLMSLDYK